MDSHPSGYGPLFTAAVRELPLIAILRGVTAAQAPSILDALVEAGFRLIEIPLNSPDPIAAIRAMSVRAPTGVVLGAGTVRTVENVQHVADAGGGLIVMPHADVAIIRAAKAAGLIALPGVATPTEAFAALDAGADGLKAFPAEGLPPNVIKSWRAVIPKSQPIFPVGGITTRNMADYVLAGASGFGLGSALYRPGDTPEKVEIAARAFVSAWRALA